MIFLMAGWSTPYSHINIGFANEAMAGRWVQLISTLFCEYEMKIWNGIFDLVLLHLPTPIVK